jgi:palmitoyltransferase ZDHHC9/14/18
MEEVSYGASAPHALQFPQVKEVMVNGVRVKDEIL